MISISKKIVAVFTTCLFVVILFYNNINKEDGSTKEATEFLQEIISNNNQKTILHQALESEMLCSDYKPPDPFKTALTNLMKDFGKHECNNANDLKLKSKGNDLVEVSAYKLNFVDLIGIKMKKDAYELSEKKQVTKPEFPDTVLQRGNIIVASSMFFLSLVIFLLCYKLAISFFCILLGKSYTFFYHSYYT